MFMSLPESLKPSDKQAITVLMSRLMVEEERNIKTSQVTALTPKTKFVKGPRK